MGSWCPAKVNPLHSYLKKALKGQPTKTGVQMCDDELQESFPTIGDESGSSYAAWDTSVQHSPPTRCSAGL